MIRALEECMLGSHLMGEGRGEGYLGSSKRQEFKHLHFLFENELDQIAAEPHI